MIEDGIKVIGVISFIIMLILGVTGVVDASVLSFIIIFILLFIVLCVLCILYFLIKWVYKGLKWISTRHKFFFRLMVVFSSLISIPIGMIYVIYKEAHNVSRITLGIMETSNPTVIFATFFASMTIIAFTLIFTVGQVLYFSIRWIRGGSKGSQFYLGLTVVLSIVSAIIGGFIASVDVSRLADDFIFRTRGIGEFIHYRGVKEAISMIDVNPSITSVFVAVICCAGVCLTYLGILWVYRGLDSNNAE